MQQRRDHFSRQAGSFVVKSCKAQVDNITFSLIHEIKHTYNEPCSETTDCPMKQNRKPYRMNTASNTMESSRALYSYTRMLLQMTHMEYCSQLKTRLTYV